MTEPELVKISGRLLTTGAITISSDCINGVNIDKNSSCVDGCGAPVKNGKCDYCGRLY